MRVLLLRPPRYVWPFTSARSGFWPPLGLLSLAAAVRRNLLEVHVEVWDAPGRKMGWRTLATKLAAERLDVLGLGEETVSAHEALRAAQLIKQLHPACVVVAGGVYFAHAVEETLRDGAVDVIVRGEGEATFVELLRHLHDRGAWETIPGLAFRGADGTPTLTRPRPLLADLDDLPFPAYDQIRPDDYGRGSRNHPDLVSVEHSRGCVDCCSFCILWKQMGESVNGNGVVRPRWRTKSPARSFDEVRWLYDRFGRRTFHWVDPTFNASSAWSDAWAERMLASDLVSPCGTPRTLHTAWLRADGVLRDEACGVLDKLVRAGLRQVYLGVERPDNAGLSALNKHHNDPEICREAFAILRERYPEVYTIGTVIFGLPGDTRADLARLARCQDELGMDYCFLMPFTPNPGTEATAAAHRGGYVANRDLRSYDFHTPVCATDTLAPRALESIYWRLLLDPRRGRVQRTVRRLVLERDRRKRRVNRSLWKRGAGLAAWSLLRALVRRGAKHPMAYWRKPSWYDK